MFNIFTLLLKISGALNVKFDALNEQKKKIADLLKVSARLCLPGLIVISSYMAMIIIIIIIIVYLYLCIYKGL